LKENDPKETWHKTACVLCSSNCGLEVKLDGNEITRVRGNKTHVGSKGYTCEKALRVNFYQNFQGRITTPLKRLPDGSHIEVDWDTAIAEVAEGFKEVNEKYGDGKILYYGGGGQGNHLGVGYSMATRNALNITRRSNALAQEKTGEAWVEGRMFGAHTHGNFHEAEVAVFLGKNPWHSHGFDEARRVLKEISADSKRSMVVIDPRRTETADLADFWLPIKPGTDAFLIAAMISIIIEENLTAKSWLSENTVGLDETVKAFANIPIGDFASRCGVPEEQIRNVARRLAAAESVAFYEDLGIEMAPHSTLVSYLQRVVWVLLGNYGNQGGMSVHSYAAPLFNYKASGSEPTDPVTGSLVISDFFACNEIADGILSDHPERNRALLIESTNPVHSLAESEKFRQAMRAVDFSVVVDVALTETAREATYFLPAATQYEKVETTFFSASFPENWICVRPPILAPPEGVLTEPEIHTRIIRELGLATEEDFLPLRELAKKGHDEFSKGFMEFSVNNPELAALGAVTLYETLGEALPEDMRGAAVLWFSAQQTALRYPTQVKAAGYEGDGPSLGNSLFEAMISNPDGVLFTRHEQDQAWDLLETIDSKIHIAIPEMLEEVKRLADSPSAYTSDKFPFVLAAGERRSFTANTIMRNPEWRKRDQEGTLRLSLGDAEQLGIDNGSRVRITTPGGSAVAVAEINETMMQGHISLPNGHGLSYSPAGGEPEVFGVPTNELTSTDWCDPIAKTPWHKHVPAQLEVVEP